MPKIIQIDPNCKYVIELDKNMSLKEAQKIQNEIDRWYRSNEVILFLFGFKLVKVGGDVTCGKCGSINTAGSMSCKFCGDNLMVRINNGT